MNYVYYGQTFAGNKQFRDFIMPQNEFEAKFPREQRVSDMGFDDQFIIDNESYKIYLMNFSLYETMKFASQYREQFIKNGFTEI